MRDFAFAAVLVAVIANSEILTLGLLLIASAYALCKLLAAASERSW